MTEAAAEAVTERKMEWVGTNKTEDEVYDERFDFLDTLSKEEQRLRDRGEFFTRMESIWGGKSVEIRAADFDVIRRTREQGKAYELCYKFIDDDTLAIGAGSRSGKTNAEENQAKVDGYGNVDCEAAHLLSHAEVCHKAFVFLGEAAVGRQVAVLPETKSGRRPVKRQKMGSNNTDALKRLKILNGIHNKNNTSLKSNKYNKMYLKEQGDLYDTENPSILVVPLLPFNEVMDWAMEGKQESYDVLTLTFGWRARRAGTEVLRCAPQECNEEEIEQARILLEIFVKGVAGSLVDYNVFESFNKRSELQIKSNASLMRWKQFVERIKGNVQRTIEVPARLAHLPENFHVAKTRLSKGNSLPDPWLLTVKAAINYSASNSTKLMPACPPLVDDDGPPNTDQGMEHSDDNVDHAELLGISMQLGGRTIELFDGDK